MEPERPIEKALREYAAQRGRQAGAPLELHPATRRVLQGEVARTYGKAASQSPPGNFRDWLWPWPRMAWATLAVALASGIWLLSPSTKENSFSSPPAPTQIALRKAQPEAVRSEPAVPAIASALPAKEAHSFRSELPGRVLSDAAPAIQTPAAPTVALTAITTSADTHSAAMDRNVKILASASETQAELAQGHGMLFQNQVPSPSLTKAPASGRPSSPSPVLASFQLEQAGNQFRVLDADGSVYSGNAQVIAPTAQTEAGRRVALRFGGESATRSRALASAPSVAANQPQTVAFQVVGTNRTLNEKVVFNGTLIDSLAALQPARGTGNFQFSNTTRPRTLNQAILLNRRITGKAIVGSSKEVPVEAVATQSP